MAGIDIRLLRAFVTLADKGNYQKAANVLFLTQPALSKQIKLLEQMTGGILFQRGRHGAALTSAGKQLYAKAQSLLISHAEFLSFAQEIHKVNAGKLKIGFGISTFHSAPVWINIFRQKFPQSDISISHIPSAIQMRMLQEGTLHVGFLRLPVSDSLAYKVLSEEQLMLAVPMDSHGDPDNIQQVLLSYPLLQIDPAANPCLAHQTACFVQNNRLSTAPVSATEDLPSLLALVAGKNGVAFVPAGISNILPAGVRLISPGTKQICWRIGVAWDHKINNRLRDDFLQVICDNNGFLSLLTRDACA